MNSITVIIPLHIFNEEVSNLLIKALQSIKDQTKQPEVVLLVVREEFKKEITQFIKQNKENLNLKAIVNKGNSNIQGQINCGVKNITTEFFSVLEFDDTYNNFWFDSAINYIEKSEEPINMALPLSKQFNKDGIFIGLGNEEPWASSFSIELGWIDNEVLSYYPYFKPSGSLIRKSSFNNIGGLKESMKVSFWYEFILRFTKFESNIFVIPKFGYNHVLDREGSYEITSAQELTKEEVIFWYETAKNEYLYNEDRQIEYIESETK